MPKDQRAPHAHTLTAETLRAPKVALAQERRKNALLLSKQAYGMLGFELPDDSALKESSDKLAASVAAESAARSAKPWRPLLGRGAGRLPPSVAGTVAGKDTVMFADSPGREEEEEEAMSARVGAAAPRDRSRKDDRGRKESKEVGEKGKANRERRTKEAGASKSATPKGRSEDGTKLRHGNRAERRAAERAAKEAGEVGEGRVGMGEGEKEAKVVAVKREGREGGKKEKEEEKETKPAKKKTREPKDDLAFFKQTVGDLGSYDDIDSGDEVDVVGERQRWRTMSSRERAEARRGLIDGEFLRDRAPMLGSSKDGFPGLEARRLGQIRGPRERVRARIEGKMETKEERKAGEKGGREERER